MVGQGLSRAQGSGFRVQGSGFRVQDRGWKMEDGGWKMEEFSRDPFFVTRKWEISLQAHRCLQHGFVARGVGIRS
jgi:hypothetical protein